MKPMPAGDRLICRTPIEDASTRVDALDFASVSVGRNG